MAVIGSIRKQSGLLIVLIGLAMVLFLLGDLFSGGGSFFNQREAVIGIIAGEKIDQIEYETLVQDAIDKQFGAEGPTESAKQSIRERIWQKMIDERVLQKEYDNLGITVSPDELLDQVKTTQPGSILYQYFTNPQTGQIIEQFRNPQTGGLDANKVLGAIQNLLNSENASDWLPIEEAIKEDVAMTKYRSLIGKGLYASTQEAKASFAEKSAMATVSYVLKEFNSIPADKVEVTEQDLKAYYEEHKNEDLYQIDSETRSLKFVSFPLIPSPEDLNELKIEMEKIKTGFVADSNDTAFVSENSDSKPENLITFYKENTLPIEIKEAVMNGSIGDVFGPYNLGGSFAVSKLTEIKLSPDSVEASHILISVQNGDTNMISDAKSKLDSLKSVAKSKNNFAELAKEFSEDLGSGENGGELGWFTRGRMVPPFEKACFEGEIGDMPIVVSQFGVHLINITNQTADKKSYLLATVDRIIEPSKATSDAIYRDASKFAVENNTLDKFDHAGAERGIIEPIDDLRLEEDNIPQIGPNSKEIIRWAFDNELGTVSNPFELDDKIVVCAITNIRPEGTLDFDQAKIIMQPEVIKKKKADMMIDQLGSYSSLDDAASKFSTPVAQLDDIRFSDNNLKGGIGREPKVVGTAFGLSENSTSKPIIGNRGVFVIRIDHIAPAQESSDLTNEKKMVSNNAAARAERSAYDAVKKTVGVEDLRNRFY
ncbi:MAG: peptidylprolyl isomerase [Flavobacteriales bacterium]